MSLHFWKNLKLPVEDPHPFWIDWNLPKLIEIVNQEPMTPEGVILLGKFVYISVFSDPNLAEGYAMFSGIHHQMPQYEITINVGICDTSEKQKAVLVHELARIYYRTSGRSFSLYTGIEEIIESEEARFPHEYPLFVEDIFKEFIPLSGFTYKFNSRQLPLPFNKFNNLVK